MNEHDIQEICARLYHGWVEKADYPELPLDQSAYASVQDRFATLGLELVDQPECPWYVLRPLREHDSFTQFHGHYPYIQSRHLALLLILYAKLLLPRRIGQVSPDSELSVTFAEIYRNYGHKFVSNRRKTLPEKVMRQLLQSLVSLHFIIKPRGKDIYLAGPCMYTLHDELLSDFAEASLQTLFGLSSTEATDGDRSLITKEANNR